MRLHEASLMAAEVKALRGRMHSVCRSLAGDKSLLEKSRPFQAICPYNRYPSLEIKKLQGCTNNNNQIRNYKKRKADKPNEKSLEGGR